MLIVFGNPSVGTPLMQEEQSIGVDLPQKFLVWEDRRRQVHITYNDPLFLGKRHAIVEQTARLNGVAAVSARLAAKGANLNP